MPIVETQPGRLCILEVEKPGGDVMPVGVLLIDPAHDKLYVRVRRDWDNILPEESDVLEAMEKGLAHLANEIGAVALLEYLQATLSNTFRMSEPGDIMVEDFERAVARLYRRHVPSTIRPFVTHLPRYAVAVAAGKFLDNQEVVEEDWIEAPEDLKLTPGMFIARIAGRSMEPKISDGSLCVFRAPVVGSRQGRLVLVEALGRGNNDRYTVKRYRSEKSQLPSGAWSHDRIRLEPLNPEFEAWDLAPEEDRYRIFAEFLRVLE
ncbi:MAG: LexA family transcriptional regulator [Bryobacterales bacterium]|nr:LexA family transcriptional regulator [Bryobacterales bacterium]MBV9398182.1 LexA family transcriptional regulator [Bryobacterales bacterium]